MKRLIMVAPHLSTGGLPQYVTKQIELMLGEYEVWCVEWDSITGGVLVVQRNRIKNLIGDGLVTLGEEKQEFLGLIDSVGPDIIHFQEVPETFISDEVLNAVYKEDRPYEIVVTTHSSYTNPSKIRFGADRFVLVSDWSRRVFAEHYGEKICTVWEYPLETRIYDKQTAKEKLGLDLRKVHILHVGLFTPGKNQAQIIEMARKIEALGAIMRPEMQFHFVGNQADNFREYWEPLMQSLPGNCVWHGERHDVYEFYKAADVFIFPSLFELNPLSLKEADSYGLELVIRNHETYDGKYDERAHMLTEDIDECISTLVRATRKATQRSYSVYDKIERNQYVVTKIDPTISIDYIEGPRVSISDAPGEVFDVSFIDKDSGSTLYFAEIGNGCWARSTIRYAVNWLIRSVRKSDGKVFEDEFNPAGKRVYVALESKSIGDTLAWFPQVDRFREKWGCQLVCSTFHNDEFEVNYPEIEFVPPGSVVPNLYSMFLIGWYWDGEAHSGSMHRRSFKELPLGQTCADILGIEYVQAKARIKSDPVEKKRKVGLGLHSTAQTKYWNNPTGWQEITNFLKRMEYEVVVMSNEGDGYMGNQHPVGASVLEPGGLDALKSEISSCEFFIGVGSGLSWLAWTLDVPTVLISGFSTPESEFLDDKVIRVFNPDVCNGCYNRYKFDPSDWNWCPDHKGTERQFECTKSITASSVVSKILENGWVSLQ